MNPRSITFTGVDDETDLDRLVELQAKHVGRVEWGVLFRGLAGPQPPRYPNIARIRTLANLARSGQVRLSLHLCGAASRAFFAEPWGVLPAFDDFDRVQVNAKTYPCDERMDELAQKARKPIIQQVRGGFPVQWPKRVQCLFDESGGRGTTPKGWPVAPAGRRVGYAGGIGPANVAETLLAIPAPAGEFWIDMESGVRTDDRFDLDKCEAVLSEVYGL